VFVDGDPASLEGSGNCILVGTWDSRATTNTLNAFAMSR
jgi:hypothetical protein